MHCKQYTADDRTFSSEYSKAQQKLKKYRARGHARGRTHPKEIVAATTAADSLSKWLEFRRHGAVEALAVEWCLYKYILSVPIQYDIVHYPLYEELNID